MQSAASLNCAPYFNRSSLARWATKQLEQFAHVSFLNAIGVLTFAVNRNSPFSMSLWLKNNSSISVTIATHAPLGADVITLTLHPRSLVAEITFQSFERYRSQAASYFGGNQNKLRRSKETRSVFDFWMRQLTAVWADSTPSTGSCTTRAFGPF